MKDNKLNIRTSKEDKATLEKATKNLSLLTDEKPSISKTIREGVKILASQDPTKPELFFINRKALRDLEVNLEYGRISLQKIIDEYNKAVGFYPTLESVKGWFGANRSNFLVINESTVSDSILETVFERQVKQYPGLKFTHDNIIVPDLTDLMSVCHQLIYVPGVLMVDVFFWDAYRSNEGKVELIPEQVDSIRNNYRIYAVTIEEKTRLSEVRKLCTIMDGIKLTNVSRISIPGVLYYDDEAGVFAPHENYVKGYLK